MNVGNVAIVILAAGSSSRLGQSKQLLPLAGTSLLQKAIDTAQATCGSNTIVVLGSQAERHRQHISATAEHIIINEQWQTGMGSSLKFGLRYLMRHFPHVESVIIMVCDQPLVTKEHLMKLIETNQTSGAPIVVSAYSSTHGVPALFHRALFGSILKIEDDHGAKKLIEANLQSAEIVNFPAGALDIDTEDDLMRLKQSL